MIDELSSCFFEVIQDVQSWKRFDENRRRERRKGKEEKGEGEDEISGLIKGRLILASEHSAFVFKKSCSRVLHFDLEIDERVDRLRRADRRPFPIQNGLSLSLCKHPPSFLEHHLFHLVILMEVEMEPIS